MSAEPSAEKDAARLAALLGEHVALGCDDKGIEQCSCGVIAVWRRDSDEVRYFDTHAEGPDLRWHNAHVAAALVADGWISRDTPPDVPRPPAPTPLPSAAHPGTRPPIESLGGSDA